MKICVRGYDFYRNPILPNTRISGLTVYTEQLLRYWKIHYSNIDFSFVRSTGGSVEYPRSPVLVDDIRIHSIDTAIIDETAEAKDHLLMRTTDDAMNATYAYRARQLATIINLERPDVLHLHNTRPAIEYIHAMQRNLLGADPVCVLTLHDLVDEPMFCIARNRWRFDAVVAISTSVARRATRYGIPAEAIRIFPSGMDIDEYRSLIARACTADVLEMVRKKANIDCLERGAFIVLMPTRRVQHKGHRDAISAIAQLIQRTPVDRKPHLLVTGAGMSGASQEVARYEEELRGVAQQFGIADAVHFLPELSRAEVCSLYHIVDVVLTPSTEPEGFCFANIEAMLSRVPVITSRTGGPLDYIIDGVTGYFIEPGDVPSIGAALLRISRQPPPTHLLIAAEEKAATFTIERIAECYMRLFEELGAERQLDCVAWRRSRSGSTKRRMS